jgi:hypothetical protein
MQAQNFRDELNREYKQNSLEKQASEDVREKNYRGDSTWLRVSFRLHYFWNRFIIFQVTFEFFKGFTRSVLSRY